MIWEGHKNWLYLFQGLDVASKYPNLEENCVKFLWPSQKTWTLNLPQSWKWHILIILIDFLQFLNVHDYWLLLLISWFFFRRPSFKYYSPWMSLIGTFLCVAVMFLMDWATALITFAIVSVLYMYISYR